MKAWESRQASMHCSLKPMAHDGSIFGKISCFTLECKMTVKRGGETMSNSFDLPNTGLTCS